MLAHVNNIPYDDGTAGTAVFGMPLNLSLDKAQRDSLGMFDWRETCCRCQCHVGGLVWFLRDIAIRISHNSSAAFLQVSGG